MVTPEADDRAARQYALAVFWDAALGFWRRGAKSTAWFRFWGLDLGLLALACGPGLGDVMQNEFLNLLRAGPVIW